MKSALRSPEWAHAFPSKKCALYSPNTLARLRPRPYNVPSRVLGLVPISRRAATAIRPSPRRFLLRHRLLLLRQRRVLVVMDCSKEPAFIPND